MPKDKKAFIFYIITTLALWQFGDTVKNLCLREDMQILSQNNKLISFVFLKNTGGAFSIFQNSVNLLVIFGIIALLGLSIYVFLTVEFREKLKILICTSLAAGILGNLAERLTNGYVTDFIKLNFMNFAVFNLFDVLISFSIILYIITIFWEEIIIKFFKKGE